ncbi:peptidoglycan D,D-transpeptidase FtsI family protein [Paenibacillus yanchengensis]|uniref:Peptidoglycan D,D-transpeptidase FtsI family protein n=1 Tax=Paenibacillus yanchengensis TaxID=2035833 RepID=A0ABW4YPY1_9BACL
MDDDKQKKEMDHQRHFSFRLNLFFFVVFALFSILVVRLAVLQFVEAPSLIAAGERKLTSTKPIAPIRGNIYDASGHAIAYSISTQSLYYSFAATGNADKSVEQAKEDAVQLAEIFEKYGDPENAMTAEEIMLQMDLKFQRNTISTPRRIKTDLNQKEIAYFMENRITYKNVDIMEESVRKYDQDTVAVQLVGYLKKFKGLNLDNMPFYKSKKEETDRKLQYLEEEEVGMDGLELMYQDVLRGKNGLRSYPVNRLSQITGPMEFTPPEKGASLYLTIDKQVQVQTEQAIMDHLEVIRKSNNRFERAEYANTGYAVAMEVDTGKVVAMASMPDYNPNIWAGGRISQQDLDDFGSNMNNGTIQTAYGNYTDEERMKRPNSIVPLGSTIKPLTVLVGLNEGLITPNTYYNDTSKYMFGREGYRVAINNSQFKAFGSIDPAQAIRHSSNTFMAEKIGNALNMRGDVDGKSSIDIWDEYMKLFGLGVQTGSGLPHESAGIINYYTEAERASKQSALIYASFGQQGSYTTLQLAQYTAMLANRGKRIKPQFVNEIRTADGELVEGYTPEVLNEVNYKEEYWKEIEQGMGQVKVEGFEGFKHNFNRKTGTSEQDVGGKKVNNAVFIAYAPAEKPKLAVAVVVPDGGYGGYGAAPIARKIFDAYDEIIGLTDKPKKEVQTDEENPEEGNVNSSSEEAVEYTE